MRFLEQFNYMIKSDTLALPNGGTCRVVNIGIPNEFVEIDEEKLDRFIEATKMDKLRTVPFELVFDHRPLHGLVVNLFRRRVDGEFSNGSSILSSLLTVANADPELYRVVIHTEEVNTRRIVFKHIEENVLRHELRHLDQKASVYTPVTKLLILGSIVSSFLGERFFDRGQVFPISLSLFCLSQLSNWLNPAEREARVASKVLPREKLFKKPPTHFLFRERRHIRSSD